MGFLEPDKWIKTPNIIDRCHPVEVGGIKNERRTAVSVSISRSFQNQIDGINKKPQTC